jgi:putative SOS response-associated peptidase YedK
MCGRFARKSTQEALADWFGVEPEDMPWFAPTYNAAPQSEQPVVRLNRDTESREVALARWGLVPFWAKDAKTGYSTINARAEEAAKKARLQRGAEEAPVPGACRRVLRVAAAGREDQAPLCHLPEERGALRVCRALGAMAAEGGEALETFTILTTDPNKVMEPIHNRMPVIVEPRDYDRWLEPGDPARPPVA